MAFDLRTALQSGDANAFVAAMLNPQTEGRTVQMANVATIIERARTSNDPALQQFADKMTTALRSSADAEKLELTASTTNPQAGMMQGFGEIWREMLGPDGKFQITDLANIDWSKLLGVLMTSVFGNAASPDPNAIAGHRSAADTAFADAMSLLRGAGNTDAANDIRQRLGTDGAELQAVRRQIDAVAPTPAASPS